MLRLSLLLYERMHRALNVRCSMLPTDTWYNNSHNWYPRILLWYVCRRAQGSFIVWYDYFLVVYDSENPPRGCYWSRLLVGVQC